MNGPQNEQLSTQNPDFINIQLFDLNYSGEYKIKNIIQQLLKNDIKEIHQINKHKEKYIFPMRISKLFLSIKNEYSQIVNLELFKCHDSPLWECLLPKEDYLSLFNNSDIKDPKSNIKFQERQEDIEQSYNSLQDSITSIHKFQQNIINNFEKKFDLRFVVEQVLDSEINISVTEKWDFTQPENFDPRQTYYISILKCDDKLQIHLLNHKKKDDQPNKIKTAIISILQKTPQKFIDLIQNKTSTLKELLEISKKINENLQNMSKAHPIDEHEFYLKGIQALF